MQREFDSQTGLKRAEIMGTCPVKAEGLWVACPSSPLSTTEGPVAGTPTLGKPGEGRWHWTKKVPAS